MMDHNIGQVGIILLTFGLALMVSMSGVSAAWWDSDFTYRKAIAVSNDNGYVLPYFQVPFNISYETGMQSDFDDIRFVSNDNTTSLDYWVETKSDGNYAAGYVEIDTIADGGGPAWFYYGNATASSESSLLDTAAWYDDFEDGTMTDWTTGTGCSVQGTYKYEGSYALRQYTDASPGEANLCLYSGVNLYNVTVDYWWKNRPEYDATTRSSRFFLRYANWTDHESNRVDCLDGGASEFDIFIGGSGSAVEDTTIYSSDTWYHMNVTLVGDYVEVWDIGTDAQRFYFSTPFSESGGFGFFARYGAGYLDNVRVFKAANSTPSLSFGLEEEYNETEEPPANETNETVYTYACPDTLFECEEGEWASAACLDNNTLSVTVNCSMAWIEGETNYLCQTLKTKIVNCEHGCGVGISPYGDECYPAPILSISAGFIIVMVIIVLIFGLPRAFKRRRGR